jgi:hypothetical protein
VRRGPSNVLFPQHVDVDGLVGDEKVHVKSTSYIEVRDEKRRGAEIGRASCRERV